MLREIFAIGESDCCTLFKRVVVTDLSYLDIMQKSIILVLVCIRMT